MDQNKNGTVTQTQPIGRSNEVLIDPETSFDKLLCILMSRPEITAAENLEREVQEREAKEARLHAEFGKDYEATEGTVTQKSQAPPWCNSAPRRSVSDRSEADWG